MLAFLGRFTDFRLQDQLCAHIEEALPSMPVEILGMNDSVYAGAEFLVTEEDKAEEIAEFKKRGDSNVAKKIISKDKNNLFEDKKDKEELNIIIKSDVQGSSEALKNARNKRLNLNN